MDFDCTDMNRLQTHKVLSQRGNFHDNWLKVHVMQAGENHMVHVKYKYSLGLETWNLQNYWKELKKQMEIVLLSLKRHDTQTRT